MQITSTSGKLASHITTLVEPVVSGHGYDLEEVIVDWPDSGPRRGVKIVVDRDGPNDLDEIAIISRDVSAILDADPGVPGDPYDLEVTSPGIDRPLTTPRHWIRARGRKVTVELSDGDTPSVTGRVGALTDDAVTLVINQRGRILRRAIEFGSIAEAVVQVDFSRPSIAELELCGLDDEEIAQRRQERA
ncbi:ribosome maturation factor RimP [Gordonia sp. (in: high G+C Gram-positive bacteria)]|uniref:ribosome maturation factor RimP n=1 Tax=Gordonia sp. (in: high G+C Gram-positive bacteria) TaxID=84139 RepID=UPI001DEB4499|nr:ribosome maturation factor RimP [Gordonia sp. (in: high G+C Gram-positive bacteria)]MCB1296150.1 ribosome maturation factor RimP [Gordonia sp. (in: high G+C Gram-positive bacteria)]HMS75975.1 ribosome maturation factor RimP [Gordonia sp. (in: high G+C Gram-positive bacteria)]HQV19823.1 ribosome maturation factor RimP [Gordonia sp. (in: high G+C Gram-positive bacteria)]